MSVRAPLLLNLLGCRVCGVERRFRLKAGVFACEVCETALDEQAANSPVPAPGFPLPSRDSGLAEQQDGAPAGAAAGFPSRAPEAPSVGNHADVNPPAARDFLHVPGGVIGRRLW